jgi:hypothetical protein
MTEKKNRKGEMTSEQLIKLGIIVLSFVIILIFMYFFSWKGQINEDTCHTSVILKKSIPEKPLVGGKAFDIPLKCKTEKVCVVSESGEVCDNFGKSREVVNVKVSSEQDIIKIVADSMAGCWIMMGESKGNMIFSRKFSFDKYYAYGVICKIIDFSRGVKEKYPKISSAKINYYMNNKVPEKDFTYWQLLTGQTNYINPTVFTSQDALNADKSIETKDPYAVVFVEYDLTKIGPTMATATGGTLGILIGIKIGAVIGTAVTPGIGTAIGAIAGTGVGIFASVFLSKTQTEVDNYMNGNDYNYWSTILLVPYNAEEIKKFNINSFENLA